MADFCKQCSIAMFGEDLGDFKLNLSNGVKLDPELTMQALCDNCGLILVNALGECLSDDCLEGGHKK